MKNKKRNAALKVVPFTVLALSTIALGSIANAYPYVEKKVIISKSHRPNGNHTKKIVVVKKNKKNPRRVVIATPRYHRLSTPKRVFIAPRAYRRPAIQVTTRRSVYQKRIVVKSPLRKPLVLVKKAPPRRTMVVVTKAPPQKPPLAVSKRPHQPKKVAVRMKPARKHPRW